MVSTIHQQKAKELENASRRKYYENKKELNPWVCKSTNSDIEYPSMRSCPVQHNHMSGYSYG